MKLKIMALDLPLLLLSLYNAAKQQGVAYNNRPAARLIGIKFKDGDLAISRSLIESTGMQADLLFFNYVDLGAGIRPIKVNLGVTVADFSEYDYHHGVGTAQQVIDNVLKQEVTKGIIEMRELTGDPFYERRPEFKERIEYLQKFSDKIQKMDEEENNFKRVDYGMFSRPFKQYSKM